MESFLEQPPLHVIPHGPILEGLNFADELADIVELAIHRAVANIGHRVDLVKLVHNLGSDEVGRDLGKMVLVKVGQDFFHCPIQAIHRHWPLFAGFDKAPEQLLPVDGFPAPILLYYPELRSFDLLVGRIAIRAIEAFASSSNRRPVLGHPGIDNFVFVGTALNTPH